METTARSERTDQSVDRVRLMSYRIDPDVLGKVAKQVVGLPLENG